MNIQSKTFLLATLCTAAILWSCGGDDPVDPVNSPTQVEADFTLTQGSEGKVTFKNTSKNATGYAWDFGDGNKATEENPTHTYTKDGTYTVKLTATNAGGSATKTATVTVTLNGASIQITADFTFELDKKGVVKFTNTSTNATRYTWDFGDGNTSNAKDTTYTYIENKDYKVKLTATNSAGESADTTKIITIINALPIASFKFSKDPQSAGGAINFENTSKNATSYAWDFGDGNTSTDENPTHTYAKDSTYTVKLTATNSAGESNDKTATITLKGSSIQVVASFTFTEGTKGGTVIFTNTSENAIGYTWDFGDGNTSIEENPTHTYGENNTYTVKLTVTNAGKSADTTQTVTITNIRLIPNFTFTKGTEGTVTFTNTSENANSYAWDFGDGNTSTDENPTHTYAKNDTYTVKLTATNKDGSADTTQTVTIDNALITIAIADLSQLVIPENSPKDTPIGEIAATVTNTNETPVYSIKSQTPAGAVGLVDGNKMVVKDSSAFDYETHTEITGEIQGTVAGVTATAAFTISITDDPDEGIYIPDAKFKAVLLNTNGIDTNGDRKISVAEAQVFNGGIRGGSDKGITDATGIEYFINIVILDLKQNDLTAIDVSKNTALTELYLNDNDLTAIDVSKNTALTELYLNDNELTAIDVSNNVALERLFLNNNQLTDIDVSRNTALDFLNVRNNQLTAIDITKNIALTQLNISVNQLTVIDVSRNTALFFLDVGNNQLTTIDVSKNTALTTLLVHANQLMVIDVSQNTALTTLWVYNNQLTAIDVSRNTALTTLYAYKNQLTAIDVSQNTALTTLYAYSNTALTKVNLANGNNDALTNLDLRDNPNLTCVQVDDPSAIPSAWNGKYDNNTVNFQATQCSN